MLTGYRRRPTTPAPTKAAVQQSIAHAFALQMRPIPMEGVRYLPLTSPNRPTQSA